MIIELKTTLKLKLLLILAGNLREMILVTIKDALLLLVKSYKQGMPIFKP